MMVNQVSQHRQDLKSYNLWHEPLDSFYNLLREFLAFLEAEKERQDEVNSKYSNKSKSNNND